jgi:uncharacterized protein YndB with AHSA1/START domain
MVWVEHIAVARERVWASLTSPGVVQPFYFNSLFQADLTPGGALHYSTADRKRIFINGRVLEILPGCKLVHEFKFADLSEPAQRVTFELEETAHGTRVTIRHEGLDDAPKHLARVRKGWTRILANLKLWLEQGRLPLTTRLQYAAMKLFIPLMPAPAGGEPINPKSSD